MRRRGNFLVRMLQMTSLGRHWFRRVRKLRPSVFANDLKNSKLGAGTTAILNISYPSYSRGNYPPEKAERKRRKKKAPGGRTFLNRRI